MSSVYQKFVECDDDKALFVGGRQSGKTTTLLQKAVLYAKDGVDIAIVAKNNPMSHTIEDRLQHRASGLDIPTITEQQLRERKPVDVMLVDEFLHFRDESMRLVEDLANRVYATTTPWTISQLSRYSSYTKFYVPTVKNSSINKEHLVTWKDSTVPLDHMTPENMFGHDIVTNTKENKEELLCVECGLTEIQETNDQIERMYRYGKFLEADCERFK